MPAATPPAGDDAPRVSHPYAPTGPPRLILITGTAIDEQTLDNLLRTRDFAAVIPLGPSEDAATSVWERIADRPELVPHTPFKLLSLMVNASRGNLQAADDDALAYEALELTRDKPSRLLRSLSRGAQDHSGVGVAGVQLPTKFLAMPLRWLLFGAARSRLLRLTTYDGQWDVKSVRQAAGNIPAEPTAEVHPIAARARAELASIYRRSFIADCAVGGVELVFAGLREGDEAFALAAELKAESRHALAHLHYYEHHDPSQRVRTGELVGLLRDLRTGPSRFAEWHHFSATGLPGAEKPILPPKRQARRIIAWTAASLVIVLGLGLGAYAIGGGFEEDPCGEPFNRDEASGQCLPIDDGSGCVNAVLRPACEAVARQNAAIAEDDPWFTIAVALPLTFEGDDASSPTDIANQIQGAAAAQALINQNQTPKARILLVDLGPSNSEWDEAAAALLERRQDANIIAVTGLGASYEDTKLFIDRMRVEGMVVMGSTITGDNMLNGGPETNTAFRVGPTNTQEAVALAAYVREHGDLCEVFNVSDSDRSYDYSITLNEAFKAQQDEAGCAESPPRPFTYNGANVEEVNPALFNETVAALCGEIEEDSYLFFAGLSRFALPSLIRSLSLRGGACLEHRITIVTGDNASSIPHDRAVVNDLRAANVNLYYIGLAHPDQWATAGEEHRASAEQMASAVDQLMHQFGTESNLENGQALMSFDAFWVTALNAQVQGASVTADSLADQLRSYSGRTATGPLQFDERGNPVGKTLTVLAATTDLEDPVEVIDLVTSA